jgi:RNA polymerase sigma-70 factor (ECF subfamily)
MFEDPPSREGPREVAEAAEADEDGLVARARSGDRTAAERLVELTYARVYGLLRRLTGDPDRAADLCQETYRKAWAALPAFRGEARVSTWLHRIAFTTYLKSRRGTLRLVAAPSHATTASDEPATFPDPPDPGPGPEAEAAVAERGERLRRAVTTLPEPLRSAVAAHYWSEIPVVEIARAEGITPVAVRKRLARAFRLLAAQLEESPR